MPPKKYHFRRWHKSLLFLCLLFLVAVNGIAYNQAYSMMHFVDAKQRTAKPEKLSPLGKLKVVLAGVELPRPNNVQTPGSKGLAYTTHRIPLPGHEWLEAWFMPNSAESGIVILFPPYAASKDVLLLPAKTFHDMGYSVLLVDFRGAGGSSGSDTTLGIREAEDVAATVAFAQRKWAKRQVILYGASMGATAVMRAIAHQGISPDAVILESPFDRLLTTVRHRFDVMGLPAFPGAELMVFWGGVQQHVDGFAHNPVEYAQFIKCPTLVMHGEADKRVTVRDASTIAKNLPGAKTFVVFPNAIGHGALAIENPNLWQQQARKLLNNVQR